MRFLTSLPPHYAADPHFYRNRRLLQSLPTPLLSLASAQLTGRGRGANVWLSPPGCLMFSLLLRAPAAQVPASKIVFVQYLAALALADACRAEGVLGPRAGAAVRIKWPNDIYAVMPDGERRKIGGILVNTSYGANGSDIVVGVSPLLRGLTPFLEVLTYSLRTTQDAASTCSTRPLSHRSRSSCLHPVPRTTRRPRRRWSARSRRRWRASRRSGTSSSPRAAPSRPSWTATSSSGSIRTSPPLPFLLLRPVGSCALTRTLSRPTCSDQPVTLTTVTPPRRVRIVGITLEYGLLRTVAEPTPGAGRVAAGPEYIDLQPDGNSFDLMAGLIKTKT